MAVVKNNYALAVSGLSTTGTASISSVTGTKLVAIILWIDTTACTVSSVVYDPTGFNESFTSRVDSYDQHAVYKIGYSVYYLDFPSNSASSKNIVVTLSDTARIRMAVYDLFNAQPGDPDYQHSLDSSVSSFYDTIQTYIGSMTLSGIMIDLVDTDEITSAGTQTRDLYESASGFGISAFGSRTEPSYASVSHNWEWTNTCNTSMVILDVQTAIAYEDDISNTGFNSNFNSLNSSAAFFDTVSNTEFTSTFGNLTGNIAYLDTLSNVGFSSVFTTLGSIRSVIDVLSNKTFNLSYSNLSDSQGYVDILSNISFTSSFNTLAIKRTYLDTISNISFNAQFDTISGTRVRQYVIVERLGYPIGTVSSPGIYVTPL